MLRAFISLAQRLASSKAFMHPALSGSMHTRTRKLAQAQTRLLSAGVLGAALHNGVNGTVYALTEPECSPTEPEYSPTEPEHGQTESFAFMSGREEWHALVDRCALNRSLVITNMGIVLPSFSCRVLSENVLVQDCDKNFGYWWCGPGTFEGTQRLFLNAHPCEPALLMVERKEQQDALSSRALGKVRASLGPRIFQHCCVVCVQSSVKFGFVG